LAGVELERGPVEGLAELTAGADEGEFGLAQGDGGWLAGFEAGVEGIHEARGGFVGDLPKGADDGVRAGVEEGPGETDESFAGVLACTGAVAGGDGDELGVDGALHDVARVEFVCAFGGTGEDDGGVEGVGAAGDGVGDEVDVGELGGVASEVVGRAGCGGGEDGRGGWMEVPLNLRHFIAEEGQVGEIVGDGEGVAEEQQAADRGAGGLGAGERGEGWRGEQGGVLDEVVGLG